MPSERSALTVTDVTHGRRSPGRLALEDRFIARHHGSRRAAAWAAKQRLADLNQEFSHPGSLYKPEPDTSQYLGIALQLGKTDQQTGMVECQHMMGDVGCGVVLDSIVVEEKIRGLVDVVSAYVDPRGDRLVTLCGGIGGELFGPGGPISIAPHVLGGGDAVRVEMRRVRGEVLEYSRVYLLGHMVSKR